MKLLSIIDKNNYAPPYLLYSDKKENIQELEDRHKEILQKDFKVLWVLNLDNKDAEDYGYYLEQMLPKTHKEFHIIGTSSKLGIKARKKINEDIIKKSTLNPRYKHVTYYKHITKS